MGRYLHPSEATSTAGQWTRWPKTVDTNTGNVISKLFVKCKYCIYPKYLDTSTPYHSCPKIWTRTIYHLMLCLKNYWMSGKRVDPDETPRSAASHLRRLIWVYTVCSGLSVGIHMVIWYPEKCMHPSSFQGFCNISLSTRRVKTKKTRAQLSAAIYTRMVLVVNDTIHWIHVGSGVARHTHVRKCVTLKILCMVYVTIFL